MIAATAFTAPAEPTRPGDPPAEALPVGPQTASDLFRAFARMEGLEARFEEEKHLALLALPLKSRGRIYFLRPGYLARIVEAPEPATLTITPNELKVDGKDGVERIDLRQNDDVRRFVTSLVRVFAGDEEALSKSYQVAFEPRVDGAATAGWTLTLTPKAKPLTDLVKELRLTGSGFAVGTIEVREPSGDRTVTCIVEADERRFSDEEKERLFGIPRP